jgi:hypothetical protein
VICEWVSGRQRLTAPRVQCCSKRTHQFEGHPQSVRRRRYRAGQLRSWVYGITALTARSSWIHDRAFPGGSTLDKTDRTSWWGAGSR